MRSRTSIGVRKLTTASLLFGFFVRAIAASVPHTVYGVKRYLIQEIDFLMECIQTYAVKRPPFEEEDRASISLRIKDAEAIRYNRLWVTAKQRSPFMEKSDMIRELLGLDPPSYVTAEELQFFRTGAKFNAVIKTPKEMSNEIKKPKRRTG